MGETLISPNGTFSSKTVLAKVKGLFIFNKLTLTYFKYTSGKTPVDLYALRTVRPDAYLGLRWRL